MIAKSAKIHIPNRVNEVGLFIFLTLLDNILKPKINKIKKGIPASKNPLRVNNHVGINES